MNLGEGFESVKIPTILGLGVLVIGLIVGVFLVSQNQILYTRASPSLLPKNITITNISDRSVSVMWQTDSPTTGFIQAGSSRTLGKTYKDDRDSTNPQSHSLHFVTLTSLTPDTSYYFKINSGMIVYPPTDALTFKTAPSGFSVDRKPVIGQIVEAGDQPITEAFIFLNIPGAQKLATITKVTGNFIIPLTNIYTEDLSKSFNFQEDNVPSTLEVIAGDKKSIITISLPSTGTPLPPITLGQDMDLSTKIISPTPASNNLTMFDLNGDGIVNSLDQGIILNNIGSKPKNTKTADQFKKADLNGDGGVDLQDLKIFNNFVSQNK